MDSTHLRFYTFATGLALLRESGFEVLEARAEGVFPIWKLRQRLPASLVERIDLAACRASPGLFGRQSLYLARPAAASPSNSPEVGEPNSLV